MKANHLVFRFLVLLFVSINSKNVFAQKNPNVIVVLADDIGLGDVSYYRKMHSDTIVVETPTLDKLSNEGIIFTDAHSPAALCAPSRYAIMTGNHCYRSYAPWGVWGAYQPSPIEKDQMSLGKLMKNAGYVTAFLGKWHMGGDYYRKDNPTKIYRGPRYKPELDVDISKIIGGGPQQNGFDYSFTYPAGIQAAPYAVYENGNRMPLHKDSKIAFISHENMTKLGVKLDKLEGLGDSHWDPHNMGGLLVDKAVHFIENESNKEKPFFMYYATQAVHKPHTPSKELDGVKIAGETPTSHLDMVKELDVQMQILVKALKRQGVYDNTLFIFTSDNGGLLIRKTLDSGHRPSDIYTGGKNQSYEGGHRVPFIVNWPEKIKQHKVSDMPILGLDIFATLASLTDQKLEDTTAMDSSNLLPYILNGTSKKVHPFLMLQGGTGKHVVILKNGWKLVIQVDKKDKTNQKRTPLRLYNLNKDPKELKNLINKSRYKRKVQKLFDLYNSTRDSKMSTGVR